MPKLVNSNVQKVYNRWQAINLFHVHNGGSCQYNRR
jgi:hypothetical protein